MQTMRMIIIQNPFDRRKRDVQNLMFQNETLSQLKNKYIPKDLDVAISINGSVIEKQSWGLMVPKLGDEIVFMPVVSDGGGDKDILGMVLMIALVAVGAPYIAGTVLSLTEGTLAYTIASTAIVVAGGMLINSLMPQPQSKLNFDTEFSQVYRWHPITSQRQGIVKPKFYGKNKLYGNVISVFTEPDDIDPTKQILNMLVSLGTGPVKGITKSDGSNYDIRVNGQALRNYDDITIEEKRGTIEQTAISLFNDTKPEYRPNRVVTNTGGSEVYTTPDNDFDDLEIELIFDRGIYYANNQGGLSNHSIDIKIEISEHDADSWNTLVDDTITDNVTSVLRRNYVASGSYTGGSAVTITRGTKYDIRVSKDTSDEVSSRYGDRLILGSVREVMEDGFKYPGLSYLAVKALATDQLSGSLEVDVIQEGAIVAVYDDEMETWGLEYSTNPAWVLYDVLSQPVISGDGSGGSPYEIERYEGINPGRLDTASFVALANFCDELVPSGIGAGTEKRITFNGGFDVGTTMWEAALKVCEIARCILIWDGTDLSVAIDKVTSPSQMFNVSNIIKDSFKQTFLPQAERVSEIEIHYRDAKQDYKRVPFSIYNSAAGNFENKITLELFGITKQSEAFRAGMFRLAQNILLKSTIEFEADIDAIACMVGDVIYVQHDVPDWREGGRILSSTNNTIEIDKPLEFSEDSGAVNRVLVRVYNPLTEKEEIENHVVASIDGNGTIITIVDTWTTNPSKDDIYCFGTSDNTARQYRVMQLSRSSEQRIKITAIEYNADIYTYDEDDPTIPISDYDSPVSTDMIVRPPNFDEIRREYPKSLVGVPTMDIPITHNLLWSGNDIDTVSWSRSDLDSGGGTPILLTYKGITYEITADNTTNKYIYWDKNDNNNTFKSTGTLANTIGADKWLMCYNDGGKEYPAWGRPVIHGGLIQASTVTANHIISVDDNQVSIGVAFDSYTKLLLHLDGADEATTATDSSNSNHTINFEGTAELDTAQKKFGTASLLLDGNSDYIWAASHADWDFGSGEFTVDCQVRLAALPETNESMIVVAQWEVTDDERSWSLSVVDVSGNKKLRFRYSTDGTAGASTSAYSNTITLTADTWYHIAIVRDGNTLRYFLDGVAIGTSGLTGVTLNNSAASLSIGAWNPDGTPATFFNGWIDEIRISKGIARWTSEFSPEEEAYSGTEHTYIDDWKKTGQTTIDGGKISCDNLAVINADMGTITAGSISASLIKSGTLIADRIQASTINGIESIDYFAGGSISGEYIGNKNDFASEQTVKTKINVGTDGALAGGLAAWCTNGSGLGWVEFVVKVYRSTTLVGTYHCNAYNHYEANPNTTDIQITGLTAGLYKVTYQRGDYDETQTYDCVLTMTLTGSEKQSIQIEKP